MSFRRLASIIVILIAPAFEARAVIIDFCSHFLAKTDRPYETRCIPDQSQFAHSVMIIHDPNGGVGAQSFFVGKILRNTKFNGFSLSSESALGRTLIFTGTNFKYNFKVYIFMRDREVLRSYWQILDRNTNTPVEVANLNCYGALWQLPNPNKSSGSADIWL